MRGVDYSPGDHSAPEGHYRKGSKNSHFLILGKEGWPVQMQLESQSRFNFWLEIKTLKKIRFRFVTQLKHKLNLVKSKFQKCFLWQCNVQSQI